MSHASPDLYDRIPEDEALRRHLKVMKTITGHSPDTCPWRAMYHPLVREVIAAMEHEETGNLALAIGADPPAILMDAIGEYKRSLSAVRADNERLRAEAAKAARDHGKRA